jgi:glutaredoxin
MKYSVRLAALAAILGCSSIWCASAVAQVYRIVGPDGRVTFSDRPPPDGKATPAKSLALPAGEATPSAALPLEVRNASSRFPVVLYTGANCAPCVSARNLLVQRGVPFTERTVSTENDIAALQRLSGAASLPFATIGSQHIRGFSDVEWAEYLDAAGYPKVSQLPPSYRNPAPTPLVAVQTEVRPAPATEAPPPARAEVPQPPAETPSNPAGIRF